MKVSLGVFFFLLCSLTLASVQPVVVRHLKQTASQAPSATRIKLNLTASNRVSTQTSVCDVFHILYDQVKQAYLEIQNVHTELELCQERCNQVEYNNHEACSNNCQQLYIENYNSILSNTEYGHVRVATMLLDLEETVNYDCVPYLKDSTVGNCYVHEYVLLNKVSSSSGTFNVERTTTAEGHYVQCRANALANQPERPNQFQCRKVFSTTASRIVAVDFFINTLVAPIATRYSECIRNAPTGIDSVLHFARCKLNFDYEVGIGYAQCKLNHDANDCDVHQAMMGFEVFGCPGTAFRRESMVDECSVPDLIDLFKMNILEIRGNRNSYPSIPDACKY